MKPSANPRRRPVSSRGRRVPGLYSSVRADGRIVYEFRGRLAGRVRTVRLDAVAKTEAIAEVESLRAGVREKRIAVSADRRTRVSDAVVGYRAFLASLAGTDGEKSVRSIEDIDSKLDLYILPALGYRRTVDVEAEQIRDLTLKAKANGRSRSTVLSVLSVASGLFAWCVQESLANHNPVAAARVKYARQMLPKATEHDQRALTDDEIGRAMEHVSESFSPVLTLLTESGIRASEALGVTWPKLDLDNETLRIDRQLGKDGVLVPTKTKRQRTIPISTRVAAVLREHRRSQDDKGFDTELGLTFVTRSGRPISRRNLLRAWQTALGKIGIEDAHLHSLRHSFISAHAERGTPVIKTAALVGHSDPAITQRVYTRVRGTEEARIEALREVLA